MRFFLLAARNSLLLGAHLAILLICATLLHTSAPAAADYLALGDSIAFGYNPLGDFRNAANFRGYPEVLAQELRLNLTNASCPGETSSGLISLENQANPTLDNGCNPYRFQSQFPLHRRYVTSQLDFAIEFLRDHPATQLVTINIGFNDIFALYRVCEQNVDCVLTNLPATLKRLSDNLNIIYTRIRQDAHYQNRIVALTNYVQYYNDTTSVQIFTAVNQIIRERTQDAGGYVADGFAAFAVASIPSALNACATPLLIITDEGCDIHPAPAGHRTLAAAIVAAICSQKFWGTS